MSIILPPPWFQFGVYSKGEFEKLVEDFKSIEIPFVLIYEPNQPKQFSLWIHGDFRGVASQLLPEIRVGT